MFDRRSFLLATSALVIWPKAAATAPRQIVVTPAGALSEGDRQRHEKYMQMAIDLIDGGPPHGTVIVDSTSGEVMCTGKNRRSRNRIYHGEMDALINCGNQHPEIDWTKLTVYATGEPCPMCMSALVWNRIPRVVFGTSIRKLTEIGLNQIGLASPVVAGAAPFYGGEIIAGVLGDKTDGMFEAWRLAR
ncbi:MAG: nucleoside deaminase [Hyphomicrobiaceae bacterium]